MMSDPVTKSQSHKVSYNENKTASDPAKKRLVKNYLFFAQENAFIVRLGSFLLALVFSVIILFNPHFIAIDSQSIQHGLLSLQMLAICCAFIHGIGFSAENTYFRVLISPFWHWPVMLSLLW